MLWTRPASVSAAAIRIREARARLGIATGLQFPQQVQLNADVSKQEVSAHAANTSPGMDRTFASSGIGFDTAWEVDIWGNYRRGVEAGRADLEAYIVANDAQDLEYLGDDDQIKYYPRPGLHIGDIDPSVTVQKGEPIYYPGERTLMTRKENLERGIPVDEKIWKEITEM
jgi:hypothetical protein